MKKLFPVALSLLVLTGCPGSGAAPAPTTRSANDGHDHGEKAGHSAADGHGHAAGETHGEDDGHGH
jgi:hypothetical protein